MNLELGMLIANFTLLLIAYVVILMFFRKFSDEINKLDVKQQSTIYGVSHIWGSIKELNEDIEVFKDETSRMIEIQMEREIMKRPDELEGEENE
tara:strand:+ start:2688 stop:2969 length:282 start_codon:yes stop_codon:yes gene_type:complete